MKILLKCINEHGEVAKERRYEMEKEAFSKLDDETRSEIYKLMEWMKINDVKTLTVTDNDEEYMQSKGE